MKKTIVVIGGVALGASSAARLRRLSEESNIILLEKDEHISFANCGLPYHIGDIITDRDLLLIQTKESMKERYNIDVRNYTEAIKIDRDKKVVIVDDKVNNQEYSIEYDKLIIASGAKPIIPNIVGINDASNVFSLRNISDMDKIKEYIKVNKVKTASIVGAGFIGLEMAENLTHLGVKATVLDLASQVMKQFDCDIADCIENKMSENGVLFKLETSIKEFKNNGKQLLLTNNETIDSDITIMAIGVKPEIKLAQDAGLEIGSTGGIKVNDYLQTSDPDIFAGGDAVEIKNIITNNPTYLPLAGPANRQGRLIADFINDIKTPYDGVIGSAVIKIFDYVAATTGLNETIAKNAGYNAKSIHVHRGNHASYYPNSTPLLLKLVFDEDTRKVLGAQAFGKDGTEKRIDVIATTIKFNGSVDDLASLELCYAPPFSSPKDPVNIAGYVASNVLNKLYIPFYVNEIDSLIEKGVQMIDVRSDEEYSISKLKNIKHLPIDELRNKINEIDFSKDIYLLCYVGQRGYLAARILKELGFKKKIYNLSGGYKLYEDTLKTR
ncbi:NADPH-dependent 2,4-dienoyl-CoA reductase/sulfur reductase-like enzyme/rhodanese-related sulfurtransferase [Bacilli bacterium PM5-9]|nr:NADPH-dependent 2,4-dienoyl-CoA reductase/sulfur reductase-like enzyme/rhodanese-related sulfurtransferase [Bacilli bacterium PM5-9]